MRQSRCRLFSSINPAKKILIYISLTRPSVSVLPTPIRPIGLPRHLAQPSNHDRKLYPLFLKSCHSSFITSQDLKQLTRLKNAACRYKYFYENKGDRYPEDLFYFVKATPAALQHMLEIALPLVYDADRMKTDFQVAIKECGLSSGAASPRWPSHLTPP